MGEYDNKVLDCFLSKQLQLFPEKVAETREEAGWFLEDMMAVVVRSKQEVVQYFEEAGIDFDAAEIMEAEEVFEVGDGRYLIVEG